jgi:aspartate/methionine/tyrosine aminotransferase
LPCRAFDTRVLMHDLYRKFRGRNLFLIGSTSKSHGTAEFRIGWAVCANSDDAAQLKKENRNAVTSASVKEAVKRLKEGSTVTGLIESSFALLRQAENEGGFELVTPERKTETGYVLIRVRTDAKELRNVLDQRGIHVMWGSEFGLSDQYIRLETLEPQNIRIFVDTVTSRTAGR